MNEILERRKLEKAAIEAVHHDFNAEDPEPEPEVETDDED